MFVGGGVNIDKRNIYRKLHVKGIFDLRCGYSGGVPKTIYLDFFLNRFSEYNTNPGYCTLFNSAKLHFTEVWKCVDKTQLCCVSGNYEGDIVKQD